MPAQQLEKSADFFWDALEQPRGNPRIAHSKPRDPARSQPVAAPIVKLGVAHVARGRVSLHPAHAPCAERAPRADGSRHIKTW